MKTAFLGEVCGYPIVVSVSFINSVISAFVAMQQQCFELDL